MLGQKRQKKRNDKPVLGLRRDISTHDQHQLVHGNRYNYAAGIPKYEIPKESMLPSAAYQIVRDEMNLDSNPAMNLASFVTTWMEPEADRLMQETMSKNVVDMNIYPQTIEIHDRCVSMLAHLFNSDEKDNATGTCCVGSSEALMLGALALKKKWQAWRKQNGKSTENPNMIMTSAVQVAWKKFCRYFDVEPRYVPVTKDRLVISVEEAEKLIDENTIGVVAVLGLTYTGHFEDVKGLNEMLERVNKEKGLQVGIHVDGATGGFIAPFLYPDLEWDFRLKWVMSINVSGHKYGFVYPGVGWVIFRDEHALPQDLLFDLSYLGGSEKTYTLNFSKSASHLILQYYNFLRLGKKGYEEILKDCREVASYLQDKIEELGKFDILSDRVSVPLVVFKLKDDVKGYTVFDLEKRVKQDQWVVPAYKLAENAEDIHVLRIVIRETFSKDMAEHLFQSLARSIQELEERNESILALMNEVHKIGQEGKETEYKELTREQSDLHLQHMSTHSHKRAKKRRGKEIRAGHGVC